MCELYDFDAQIMLQMLAGKFRKNKVPVRTTPELYFKNPVIARDNTE